MYHRGQILKILRSAPHGIFVFWINLFYLLESGMSRPQVADGGTASNMDSSCEYIE